MPLARIGAVLAAGASILGGPNGEFTAFVTLAGGIGIGVVGWRRHRSRSKD